MILSNNGFRCSRACSGDHSAGTDEAVNTVSPADQLNPCPQIADELSFEETRLLLDDVPNASYQFGSRVVGPFGPAKSAAFRDFSPSHGAGIVRNLPSPRPRSSSRERRTPLSVTLVDQPK